MPGVGKPTLDLSDARLKSGPYLAILGREAEVKPPAVGGETELSAPIQRRNKWGHGCYLQLHASGLQGDSKGLDMGFWRGHSVTSQKRLVWIPAAGDFQTRIPKKVPGFVAQCGQSRQMGPGISNPVANVVRASLVNKPGQRHSAASIGGEPPRRGG